MTGVVFKPFEEVCAGSAPSAPGCGVGAAFRPALRPHTHTLRWQNTQPF